MPATARAGAIEADAAKAPAVAGLAPSAAPVMQTEPGAAAPTAASTQLVAAEPVAATPAPEVGGRAEQAPQAARCRGVVKWFDRGYGFIRGEDGRDAFVHSSGISHRVFPRLSEGQLVEYEVQRTPKGLQAVAVTPLHAVAARSR